MERRLAPLAGLVIVLAMAGVAFGAAEVPASAPQADVTWPVSSLLVSEVQTGGASASDEFAEITNVGAAPVDLAGLELVYVTSTGGTITRKASWAATLLVEPGRHLLVANGSGIYASLADATYSGGFAATGGSIVLRAVGGAPIDAVGWGDATNTFVEGVPAAAPAAGASIERRPGGQDGNTVDTNVNAVDWFAQASPNPQSLAAPPVPAPTGTATPAPSTTIEPTSEPTAEPSATIAASPETSPSAPASATPAPTMSIVPTVGPSPEPTVEATASPSSTPTPSPTTPEPTATASPTPDATPPATPAPTPLPPPSAAPMPIIPILQARGLPDGSRARVMGVLTTHLGALETGRKAFIQDDGAGIAIYLDVAVLAGLPADSLVVAQGTIDERFGERTLRVAPSDVVLLMEQQRPPPWQLPTGEVGEVHEGYRVIVQGTTVGAPTDMADGLGLMVDDGSGAVRVIVGPAALGGVSVPAGTFVVATGPVGQRDSTGTGVGGYRIHATEEGDFGILPPPTPSPTPVLTATPMPTATPAPTATRPPPTSAPTATPMPSPTPTSSPRPTATPSPRPTATPAPSPPPTLSVVEARGAPVGTVVVVAGVVTAEAGRLGTPSTIAIADGTGGIVVRLPDGIQPPARGATVLVRGPLAEPYGQLELRPTGSGFQVTGQGSLPGPMPLVASELGEATEGRLAELTGTVAAAPRKGTSGDLTIDLTDASGSPFRVVADGSSGIVATDLAKGRTYRLTGIVGQRASRKGALDGYRLFVRDRGDIVAISTTPAPGASGGPSTVVPVSTALAAPEGATLTVEATVTAGTALLDSSGRRIVVQDASGAIEVLLPAGHAPPSIGAKLRVTGTAGTAWGAPRLAASAIEAIGTGGISPVTLGRSPAERDEWLLVRLSGTVERVERLGDRWRAEIELAGGAGVAVHGQAGAGIPSTAILVGRRITVVGIVKRPYPTASDRRFAVLPRSPADVAIGPAGDGGPVAPIGGTGAGPAGQPGTGGVDVTPDTDLAMLLEHVGERVRVGGLVARLAEDGFDLDDGTALARVVMRGELAALLPYLREGEAVAATGSVELVDGAPVVVIDDDGTLVRVGSLGQALPIGGGSGVPDPTVAPTGAPGSLAADSALFGPSLAPTSLLALALLTLVSVAATLVRRRLARHRLRTQVVARLGSLGQSSGASGGGSAGRPPG